MADLAWDDLRLSVEWRSASRGAVIEPVLPKRRRPARTKCVTLAEPSVKIQLRLLDIGVPCAAVASWEFPPLEPFDYLAAIQALESGDVRQVKNQHTVSKVLLKGFAARDRRQQGWQLSRFDKHRRRELDPKGLDACGKVPNFVQYASRSAEDLWHGVETKLDAAIKSAESGTLHEHAEHESTIKDAIALHLVRTPHFRRIHDSSFSEAVQGLRQEMLGNRQHMLAVEFRRRHGLEPAGVEALEHVLNGPLQVWQELHDSGKLFRIGLEQNYYRVRAVIRGLRVQVLQAPTGKEFLISDAPAFTFTQTPNGDMTVRMAIGDSNGIALPITRTCLVSTCPEGKNEEIAAPLVDNLNRIQVRLAERQVYYRPGGNLAQFVDQALAIFTLSVAEPPR